jgi:hypothetical protein
VLGKVGHWWVLPDCLADARLKQTPPSFSGFLLRLRLSSLVAAFRVWHHTNHLLMHDLSGI